MDLIEASTASPNQRWTRTIKLLLFLLSLGFSAAAFLAFDWFYSPAILRSSSTLRKSGRCGVPDPVRHHALRPNCAFIEHWGADKYEYFTNSLGLRDEKIREVPLADSRPRILVLGDSFTEGEIAWRDSYVGMIAARFPQYDFLNGGQSGYSPSNYLNTVRILLAAGVKFDEVIVFSGIGDVQDEAAQWVDIDASGAVTETKQQQRFPSSWYRRLRSRIASHLLLTNDILEFLGQLLVRFGYYHLTTGQHGNPFDMEISAWTYRKVNETDRYPAGYAPLGVEGGIAREMVKMDLLWQELEKHNIPISVVASPWPPQIAHDTVDSRQVRMWREWCEGKCKRFISVFPAFFAAKAQCPPLQPGCWYMSYFVFGDHHYNAAGNALVADAVIQSLTQEPPVKRPKTDSMSEPGRGFGVH